MQSQAHNKLSDEIDSKLREMKRKEKEVRDRAKNIEKLVADIETLENEVWGLRAMGKRKMALVRIAR